MNSLVGSALAARSSEVAAALGSRARLAAWRGIGIAPHLFLCRCSLLLLLRGGGGAARVAAGAALHREQLKGLPPRLLLQRHPLQQLHRVHALAKQNLLLVLILLPCARGRRANGVSGRAARRRSTRLASASGLPVPHPWWPLSGNPPHRSLPQGSARRLRPPRAGNHPRWRSFSWSLAPSAWGRLRSYCRLFEMGREHDEPQESGNAFDGGTARRAQQHFCFSCELHKKTRRYISGLGQGPLQGLPGTPRRAGGPAVKSLTGLTGRGARGCRPWPPPSSLRRPGAGSPPWGRAGR